MLITEQSLKIEDRVHMQVPRLIIHQTMLEHLDGGELAQALVVLPHCVTLSCYASLIGLLQHAAQLHALVASVQSAQAPAAEFFVHPQLQALLQFARMP
jgi:hypothetical protein